MGKHYYTFFIIIFTFLSCEEKPNKILLLHEDWQFSEVEKIKWQPANVPGTVQADLLRLGEIPDPFLKNNEDSIQWVSSKNWQYKKQFSVSEEILKRTKHFLKFEGLDTYAEVFLNDSLILSTNNAFRSWEVDVSDALKAKNKLLVDFKSPDSIEKAEAKKLNYKLPEGNRVFTRKPQYQYGWDWAPTIKTMGIWRNVSLESYDIARLKDVFLQTKSISDSLAEIVAKFEIETLKAVEITLRITNKNTSETISSTFKTKAGESEFQMPFSIKNPKLWWTHNLGDSFLYDIEIELLHNKNVLETYSKNLGIRTIELVTEKDSIGESFYFKLNGKPVYMKGANYVPQQMLDAKIDREKYTQLIGDAVSANMNMLRIWGGGIYEDDYFYNLCDEKGILIWQDFMFACAMYPGDAEFLENAKQEAIENVKRLRNHPSIALWCGNNENNEGWHRWGWQEGKTEAQKQEIWDSYYALFNHILPRVVDSLSPKISYWESSPKFGRGDKRYQFQGDAHDWWVWHDGYPFEHFEKKVPRFMSEFGFQSFPSPETVKYATGRDSVFKNDPLFANHQKHVRGFKIIEEYMARDFPVPQNAEDYMYVSQLLQARGITMGIHAHRRAKPYNMGTLYWQLNDCWPAISWSSIDYLGNWKALHYKAKKAFENVLISTEEKKDTLNIFVVNDSFKTIKDSLVLKLLNFDGEVIHKKQLAIESPENSSKIVYSLPLETLKFDRDFSVLKINFGKSEYLNYFVKPKDLKLKKEEIEIEVCCSVERSRDLSLPSNSKVLDCARTDNNLCFSVTLVSKTLQKNVFLEADEKGKFDDNFFDLLPNEPKTILFSTESKTPPKLKLKTLNQLFP
ncbi:beta-mannosidase [Aequorivita marisscotiae]|uniref:Beta-mannosidase B n=1 Tax=Aequorivita marisscotiae TaxID=3040348 RepID=A0ABY8KVV6_9FLAO|nr:glycoside hydrolase family 2 protein [Aequorivita sp. Ant34-E75]WGF93540.1 glycoside hydrolase family 2 protein [Aequorivita sp. Ant34-E75]